MNKKTIDNFDEYSMNFFAVRFVFVYYESGYLRIFVAIPISRLPNFTGMAIILQPHAIGFVLYVQNFPSKRTISDQSLELCSFS
jgi:hypothetical protein